MARATGSDLLHGWKVIAEYLGLGEEGVRHLARKADLPVFRPGKSVYAWRPSVNE